MDLRFGKITGQAAENRLQGKEMAIVEAEIRLMAIASIGVVAVKWREG